MKQTIKILLMLVVVWPIIVIAEESTEFSLSTWVSEGQTKWSFDNGSSLYGRPTSELDYQKVASHILEIGVNHVSMEGHKLELNIGTGSVSSGLLVDDDYVSADGAISYNTTKTGEHRFSRTHSEIDSGSVQYLKGQLMPKDLQIKSSKVELGFGLIFSYWYEEYIATGVHWVECTALVVSDIRCLPAGTTILQDRTVITNKVEWTGLGLAMGGTYQLTGKLALNFDLAYYPYMSLKNEDTHHLRPDAFAQDPSISMNGDGTGVDLLAGLTMRYTNDVSIFVIYRYWERNWEGNTKNKDITFYSPSGGATSYELLDFKTQREGFSVGFKMKFD
ncbi:MAG: hypothetical protein OEY52_05565 [Gammaproteobacteria bacterium]|nr:hypothetical protein [Gammaproteobacteria bacterium]